MPKRTSLLDTVDIHKMVETINSESLDAATTRRSTAFANVVMTIEDISENIAEQHRKPVAGLNAEASYLERLDEGLKSNRSEITAGFSSTQAQPDQGQAHELETVRSQLAEAENANADLQRSARRVSDLEIENGQLTRGKESLERQLNEWVDEVERLKSEALKPNPLKAEIDQLKADKRQLTNEVASLTEERDQLKAENEDKDKLLLAAEQQLDECLHRKDDSSPDAGTTSTDSGEDSSSRPSWLRRPERKSRPQSSN